jgi:hypothetical protein
MRGKAASGVRVQESGFRSQDSGVGIDHDEVKVSTLLTLDT